MFTPNPELVVDLCLYHGGNFRVTNNKRTEECSDGVEYVAGKVNRFDRVKHSEFTYFFVKDILKKLISRETIPFLWYIKVDHLMAIGRTLICSDKEMKEALDTAGELNMVNLYVTEAKKFKKRTPLTFSPVKQKAKKLVGPFNKCTTTNKSIPIKSKVVNTSATISTIIDVNIPSPTPLYETPISELLKRPKIPYKKLGIVIRDLENEEEFVVKTNGKEIDTKKGKEKCISENVFVGEEGCHGQGFSVEKWWGDDGVSVTEQLDNVRGKFEDKNEFVVEKSKGKERSGKKKNKEQVQLVKKNRYNKSKVSRKKSAMGLKTMANKNEMGKKRKKWLIFEDDVDVSEDSEYSDLDIDFQIGEDDLKEDDIFEGVDDGSILRGVEGSLAKGKILLLEGVNEPEFVFTDDDYDEDSEDLMSLDGSDEEMNDAENYPLFKQDFTRNVELSPGLKFVNNSVLRKALVRHSIEHKYDFYYLHSSNTRVTTYCRYRCTCPWNIKVGRIKCRCKLRVCHFKIHATKMNDNMTFQIKSMNLKHTCERTGICTKVSSEYLADKYLEEWRDNPTWDLQAFQVRIKRDTGYEVTYQLCWLARARMRSMIYGDASEQYSRVWDYAAVIRKYNPGSTAIVVIGNIERPPPLFQRMYICLKACKEGWLVGCRPILGVDGCHLRGPFPGICLVAVGMDGNNNIYPIAWGVVDVENANTWTWFLRLLLEDLDKENGNGLTFMSDRQKGLLDAFTLVASKADIRYCSRHIWANFKLRFSGQAYKDVFWRAARCTTKVEFDAEMMGIKFLNPDAYAYLAAIQPKHWSRHAFSTSCKSNMLLNNMCESFNNVIKEARGKPILTHMEWMRRYAMKRLCEKREGTKTIVGNLMPYATKYLKWVEDQSRFCTLTQSSNDIYEVDWRGDSFVVDLNARKCTCFHWQLTGLPCAHAMGCIIYRRAHFESYVDAAYTKATYDLAYKSSILPIPGVKHWEKVDAQVEPLPPPYKKLPGRPNMKKRRKEAGEGKKIVKVPKTCGKCGKLGHNVKTCNNSPKVIAVKPAGKPLKTLAYNKKQREAAAKRKAAKDRLEARNQI